MNLNATLLGQMLTFALFVWFTMRYVWPPIMQALSNRQKKIAEGLAAAERGTHELELAQQKAKDELHKAKINATDIIEQANQRATQIIEEARGVAKEEAKRLIELGKDELRQQVEVAKQTLRHDIAELAICSAERILQKNIDEAVNRELIDKLITEI